MIAIDHPGLQLLDAMWGSTPGSWSTLSHRPTPGVDRLVHTAVRTDDRDAWARWLAGHEDTDAYFRVCPMEEEPDLPAHRGDAAASIDVPGLWADIDERSAKHPNAPDPDYVRERLRLLDQHVRLSAVVSTGNGWQVYVFFDEPVHPIVAVDLLARWDAQLRNLGLVNDRKGDLASLMRLPGTLNTTGGRMTTLRVPEVGA